MKPNSVKIVVEIAGELKVQKWSLLTVYCPFCGSKSVWRNENSPKYEPDEHVCLHCKKYFELWGGVDEYADFQSVVIPQILKSIENDAD